MSQTPHERQLDLLLHELQAAVHYCCWEGHGNKAGDTIQETFIILQHIHLLSFEKGKVLKLRKFHVWKSLGTSGYMAGKVEISIP